jgi:hypothetical protein
MTFDSAANPGRTAIVILRAAPREEIDMPLRPRHLFIAAAVAVAGCGSAAPAAPGTSRPPVPATTPTAAASSPPRGDAPPVEITYPAHGHRQWKTAPGQRGGPDGRAGKLLRYRVLVEKDVAGLPPAGFADTVTGTLGAAKGWTAGGLWRFRRVGSGEAYDFTVYLATPDTRDALCDDHPDGYTSCRNGDDVVLNVARWVKGVPEFGGDLAAYRAYMVNHEVGHRLGQGHQLCPGDGRAAPVMQQQTLGLHGCRPNPWPYPYGTRFYAGRSGVYTDRIPPRDRGRSPGN